MTSFLPNKHGNDLTKRLQRKENDWIRILFIKNRDFVHPELAAHTRGEDQERKNQDWAFGDSVDRPEFKCALVVFFQDDEDERAAYTHLEEEAIPTGAELETLRQDNGKQDAGVDVTAVVEEHAEDGWAARFACLFTVHLVQNSVSYESKCRE